MIKSVILILIIFILNSCGGSGAKSSCSVDAQNRYVYNYMKDTYLWYKEMKEVDYTKYGSVYDLFEALKVSKDHWSFIVDKQVFDDYFSGKGYIGYGFKFDEINGKYYLQLVFDNSSAKDAGLKRGDEIVTINNKKIDTLSKEDIVNLLGNREVGVEANFTLKRGDSTFNVTLKKRKVTVKSVMQYKVFDVGDKRVGYILFDKFIETSFDELNSAFKYFKNKGVDTLVIDLRYNGGGLVSVAQHFASLIKAEEDSNLLFKLQFNDKNRDKDMSYRFKANDQSLNGINKVYFLTTRASCSSSEALINSLKPYMDVKIIGSKTCGKPVGMVGGELCDKYIVPIEFQILNSQGVGGYFNGLSPTCQVTDDVTHNLGDNNEAMLKEAIYYINNGSCSVANGRLYRKSSGKSRSNLNGANSVINAY